MAPAILARVVDATLERRRTTCYYDAYGYRRCRNTAFSSWGRWVVLGVLVGLFFLFLLCACFNSRKRRRRGAQPFAGTGWMSQGPLAPPPYQAPPQYSAAPPAEGYNAPQQPKPAYNGAGGAPYNTNNAGSNGAYYNNNNNAAPNNYEMGGYQPPAGPPPQHYK